MSDFEDPYDADNNLSENDTPKSSKSSEDFDLQEKIKKTYKTIKHLRECLATAKENLETERLQSKSYYGYPWTNIQRNSYPILYYEYPNYEVPQPYFQYPVQNHVYYATFEQPYQIDMKHFSHAYIDQLNDVHKRCNEELNKMHKSICDLRRIKRDWAFCAPKISYSTPTYYLDKRPAQRHRKRHNSPIFDDNCTVSSSN